VVAVTDILQLLEDNPLHIDALVEATNTVAFAARAVECALRNRIHVVLMNAEVDLLLGPWLHELATRNGVGVTSDAGDQHGVLMRMIEEMQLWGFDVKMAGNIKGFLDRYATASSIAEEARKRALNPIQCVAYTDGTKLNIEMALVANATGLLPFRRGMEGPRAQHVSEVFEKFDFSRYGEPGVVDYILGAAPHGGVFVVGHCDVPFQQRYLEYYKLGSGPYYLFYRPCHLCHIETPRAIARLVLFNRKVLEPTHGKLTEVVALAKRALPARTRITHGIGSDDLYGMIERSDVIERDGAVPVGLLDFAGGAPCIVTRAIHKDELITLRDLEMPDSLLQNYDAQQRQLNAAPVGTRPSSTGH
jgi:predicted homoserine dehydrogenase-like protein